MTEPGYDDPRYDDRERRRRGGAWLWWALAALALLLVAILLLARGCGDDDGDGSEAGGAGPAQVDAGAGGDDTAPAGTAGGEAGGGETGGGETGGGETGDSGSGSGGGGSLTDEGGRDLLALAGGGGALRSVADGRTAQGDGVRVQSVVGDEVFWVGASERERVLVHLVIGGESPPQVKAGQRVSFTGRLLTLPDGAPGIWGVERSEGAAQVTEQGLHVEVDVADLDLSG